MSIQSIIGGQALALNVLSMIPPIFQRDVGLRPLLAHTLRLAKAESMSHQQDAVDGLPRRHRGRTRVSGTNRLESSVFLVNERYQLLARHSRCVRASVRASVRFIPCVRA